MLPATATDDDRREMERRLGLDQPLYVQYAQFFAQLATGQFGRSLRNGAPVADLIKARLPNTVLLAAMAMTFAIAVCVPAGVLAAVKRGTLTDSVIRMGAVFGLAAPNFWLGLLLIQVFAVQLRLLPVAGTGNLSHLVLPTVTFGLFFVAGIARLLRSSMLELMRSDFVTVARAKGLAESVVVWRHVFRNSVIPFITLLGVYLPTFVAGAIVVETVFAWPGIGRLTYEAVLNRDFPVVQGVVMLNVAFVIGANLLIDMLYVYLDPRIRYG